MGVIQIVNHKTKTYFKCNASTYEDGIRSVIGCVVSEIYDEISEKSDGIISDEELMEVLSDFWETQDLFIKYIPDGDMSTRIQLPRATAEKGEIDGKMPEL